MNTSDIRAALTLDNHTRPRLGGVFSYDQVVRNLTEENERIYVFNTQPSLRPGEHWMVFATRNSEVHYFDSFGRHPRMYPQLSNKMEGMFNTIYWNNYGKNDPDTVLVYSDDLNFKDYYNWGGCNMRSSCYRASFVIQAVALLVPCLLYTSPSPRDPE